MKPLFSLLFCYFIVLPCSYSQIVNAYAKVTGISGTTLQVSLVDEAFDSFEDGEQILIYQVQDSVVNDFSNTANFGDLFTVGQAGLFEVATILSHTEVAGLPNSITLSSPLTNPYNSSTNASLQIVSFPQLGSPNFSTTNAITGRAWNGNTGGVVAFQVTQTLILNHDIQADGLGFRGGTRSRNFFTGVASCNGTFVYRSPSDEHAFKGEGIYKNNNTTIRNGRGKLASAGGGGNHINAGGGGGGNQTEGGAGGSGWNATATGCPLITSCGGVGGLSLFSFIQNNRLFLGGAGGGGQQNNSQSSDGGNGGGFVFIQADSLQIPNCSSTPSIRANGQTALSRLNDGMGGGGAGGSILLQVNHFSVPTSCPLQVVANGGAGGNVNSSTHGGGGGGGQGAIRLSSVPPTNQVATIANSGAGGCNNSACSFVASPGGDSAILLTTEWLYFDAIYQPRSTVTLQWAFQAAQAVQSIELQRSTNGHTWSNIHTWLGELPAQQYQQSFEDQPLIDGQVYYRVKANLQDGSKSLSAIQTIYKPSENIKGVSLGPNPTTGELLLQSQHTSVQVYGIYNTLGQAIDSKQLWESSNQEKIILFQLHTLEAGIYMIHTSVGLFKIQKQ